MPDNGSISQTIDDGIATIEFHHPKGNSLPGNLLRKLAEELEKAKNRNDVKVIVLRSKGERTFCGGAFFDEMLSISTFEEGKRFFMGFAHVLNAMRASTKFILTRVQGKVVGGGAGLIAASDCVFAHSSASVRLSELSLGIGPFVIAPALRNRIPQTAFTSLSLDSQTWHDARWAESNALYTRVFDDMELLDRELGRLASELTQKNPAVLAELRQLIWQSTGHWESTLEQRAELNGRFVNTDFARNLIRQLKK